MQRDFIAAGTNIRAVDDDKENRTFDLSFSSEEPCQQWFGVEILDHDPAAVDMSRMQDVGVLLYNHNRDKVIGTILRAWIENGRGMATVKFDDDADSEIIRAKVASGTLKGVSVGYRVTNYESVKEGAKSLDGRFAGPCYVAKKWIPYEISIVSVPADATVGVGRELGEDGPQPDAAERPALSYFESCITANKNH